MAESTIESIRARAVLVPLRRPLITGSGQMARVPLVLTDIRTNAGITGHSYIFVMTPLAAGPTAQLIENATEIIAGQPAEPLAVEALLARRFKLLGVLGLVQYAIAAIDMALWDAFAKARGLPLAQALGAGLNPTPAYDSRGLGLQGEAAVLAEARAMLAETGLPAIKLRLGYPTTAEDAAVARALRGALPDAVQLMTDYNQCLNPALALERCRALEDLGLAWIEEPTLAHDHTAHAAIARDSRTLIQLGENFEGPRDMARALAAGACDLAMPDLMRIGGVTGWIRAAAIADAAQMPMSSHLFPEFSAHCLAATPTAQWLEYVDWAEPILTQPVELRDGRAWPSRLPGAGVEWNEAAITRYSLEL
jgi:mandelate racemase